MKKILAASFLCMFAGAAAAQSANPPANSNPSMPATTSPNSGNNAGAPAAGANSFTEAQAKSRIEKDGFSSVSNLKKDDKGVWRGKGTKSGKTMDVSLDYQGNIVAK
jgi:opacity protein-like surface antigen